MVSEQTNKNARSQFKLVIVDRIDCGRANLSLARCCHREHRQRAKFDGNERTADVTGGHTGKISRLDHYRQIVSLVKNSSLPLCNPSATMLTAFQWKLRRVRVPCTQCLKNCAKLGLPRNFCAATTNFHFWYKIRFDRVQRHDQSFLFFLYQPVTVALS